MSLSERLSPLGRSLLDRRNFLRNTGMSMGGLGLAHLLADEGLLAAETKTVSGTAPIRPNMHPAKPYAARQPHFPAAAKQVLVIFCPGAVSHVDTVDYKPALFQMHGKSSPFFPAVTFEGPPGNIAQPFWEFKPRGESGKMISDLVPHLAQHADDFCFFHSLTTKTSAHPQGENFFNTGFTMEGFPSYGAWVTYALGTENQELPAFVAINDPRGMARSGKNNFGSGFLPAAFQATDFNAKHPPNNLARPAAYSAAADRQTVDLLTRIKAGAGVKRAYSYGESDEFGFKTVANEATVYDFNATLLHLLGLDHERLTFYHNGLERRLTDVHGSVIKDVLAGP